ncbi:MAG: hypothetical protein FJ057_08185 [Cyanobacteria bacterium K_DeepCast_0m_m1_088]|nr:hypothetical protein [Cyanobacteria bacterium K_DeepCast_0m_m1_088]
MLEKAIIHIGLHKTGSSSIQSSLLGYNDGFCFYADLGWANHSIPLYTAFSNNANSYHIWDKQGFSPEQIQGIKKEVLLQLEQQLSKPNCNTIVFSGEDLSTLSQSETHALVAFLRERCQRIVAVVYVRDPLDFAASAFQQLVKGGCAQIPRNIGQQIQHKIGIWEQVLGAENVQIRSFDREKLRNGCVVQDFCHLAGVDPAKIAIKRKNESINGAAVKVLFHLNQTSPLQFGDPSLVRTRQRLLKVLSITFADLPVIDKHFFVDLVDQHDIEYLRVNQLINFSNRALANSPLDPSLDQWLVDLDPEIHARLCAWLIEQGHITSWHGSTSQLIHRTFYAILQTDLLNTNSSLLRKSALSLRDHSAGNVSDSMALLELARMGSPFSRKIKQAFKKLHLEPEVNRRRAATAPGPSGACSATWWSRASRWWRKRCCTRC